MFQPAVYIVSKRYRRGVLFQGIGIVGVSLGMYCFGLAVTVGMPTLELLILGMIIIWTTYGVTLYDCIRIVRNRTSRQSQTF